MLKAPNDIISVNPTNRSATAKLIRRKEAGSLESVAMLPKHACGKNVANDDDQGLDCGSK